MRDRAGRAAASVTIVVWVVLLVRSLHLLLLRQPQRLV